MSCWHDDHGLFVKHLENHAAAKTPSDMEKSLSLDRTASNLAATQSLSHVCNIEWMPDRVPITTVIGLTIKSMSTHYECSLSARRKIRDQRSDITHSKPNTAAALKSQQRQSFSQSKGFDNDN